MVIKNNEVFACIAWFLGVEITTFSGLQGTLESNMIAPWSLYLFILHVIETELTRYLVLSSALLSYGTVCYVSKFHKYG